MLITVPAHQWLWGAHDVFLQHNRRYTAKTLRKTLTNAGLRVERLSYFNMWLLPLAMLARLKDRLFRSGRSSGTAVPARFINRALFSIFRSERYLLDWFDLPAGVSLLAVVRRGDGFASPAGGGSETAAVDAAPDVEYAPGHRGATFGRHGGLRGDHRLQRAAGRRQLQRLP